MFRILKFICLLVGLGLLVVRLSLAATVMGYFSGGSPLAAGPAMAAGEMHQGPAAFVAPMLQGGFAAFAAPQVQAPAAPARGAIYQGCASRRGVSTAICACLDQASAPKLSVEDQKIMGRAVAAARSADVGAMAAALNRAAPQASFARLSEISRVYGRAASQCL